ncbi:AzlD domain-containing protein [Desulfolutivibrio sulfoxidireducens]|uniref:AzlD domain-containing protein n=1 Tax=Desulfolutivibrio sulfoxidireducens TaxID=2773299 RepID=UPI00159D276C|nr:AzlD domain-containing protein [Desulfolutivibrio sulfoxidireducens]QLA17492.1 AzlD domain-containing protein [Desulfolutivibrio sulfoxidireducens]
MAVLDQTDVFVAIVGMALVTYLPRAAPLVFLSGRTLPALAIRFLRLVPAAVLSALLFPSILAPGGSLDLSAGNFFLLGSVPAVLMAWRTGSFFGAVAVGMGAVAGLRYFFG